MKAISIGVLGALFFSITFILNHAMSSDGGSWLFSASLRFIFMFPFLFVIVMFKQRHHVIVLHIKQHFWMWLLWSSFGFVFFTYQSLLYPTIVQAGLFLRHGNLPLSVGYYWLPFSMNIYNMNRKRSKSENVSYGVH